MLVEIPPFSELSAELASAPQPVLGFEGPEKLLEVWFRPNVDTAECRELHHRHRSCGLRTVDRPVWEDMLSIVKCQVLSRKENDYVEEYVLSESSMFVYSHKIILKTCGTTTLLLALPRILEIAHKMCGLELVDSVFYSRKAFMFPAKQKWPHGNWGDEVLYLDTIFRPEHFHTSGYVVGKINGEHWNLYTASPRRDSDVVGWDDEEPCTEADEEMEELYKDDLTLEVLMSELNPEKMKAFWKKEGETDEEGARRIHNDSGLGSIYPHTTVDDHCFDPCGYSLNGLIDQYYWTVHVTPEDHCSYASFETNIPISVTASPTAYQSYEEVVRKVISVFEPGKVTVTLFSRKPDTKDRENSDTESRSESGVSSSLGAGIAPTLFQFPVVGPGAITSSSWGRKSIDNIVSAEHSRMVLTGSAVDGYLMRDRVVYDLGGWDLVFAQFTRKRRRAFKTTAVITAADALPSDTSVGAGRAAESIGIEA
ncbi:spermidine resistance protein [Gonapodya sp. JEL0774]|nr:spermidine resistance protein [Gonapodya sp. JEL0774]